MKKVHSLPAHIQAEVNRSNSGENDLRRYGSNPNLTVLCDQVAELGRFSEQLLIVVVGASGDLAKKKTYPALFSLFYHNLLPKNVWFIGFARSGLSHEEFRANISGYLTCRVINPEECESKTNDFLSRCYYKSGGYGSVDSFRELDDFAQTLEKGNPTGRLFYLAIPPTVFGASMESIRAAATSKASWTRVIVEKPFGRSLETYHELRNTCAKYFIEDEIYRIDHYVGKEVVQNITTLRFGNYLFGALWNCEHIQAVHVIFKENFGTQGRAGYFDSFGIIRDIMQNHLLQVLAYVAMERPSQFCADFINLERLAVLKAIRPIALDEVVVGQYEGYKEEEGVKVGSNCPTFAACVLHVDTPRWKDVPFLMKAGKGLNERKAEIRIIFRGYSAEEADVVSGDAAMANELVIRIQPNEGLHLDVLSKVPGLRANRQKTQLDLSYQSAFEEESKDIADAYERLILDAVLGEKSLFIHDDQLDAAWRVFDPVLTQLETVTPEVYEFGSTGPKNQHVLAEKCKTTWRD